MSLLVRAHRGRWQGPPQGFLMKWRGARVAEGARLEIVCTVRYRGFESLSLLRGKADQFRARRDRDPGGVAAVDRRPAPRGLGPRRRTGLGRVGGPRPRGHRVRPGAGRYARAAAAARV